MGLTKVLITVKTYPTISPKYEELVCTAGFKEDGSWVRIYPVPFRKLDYAKQYKKYDWIECELIKNTKDFRPESFRPKTLSTDIKIIGHLGTERNWLLRKKIALNKVYTNLKQLIKEAKDKETGTSLAVFKPSKIIDFVYKAVEREWDESKLTGLKQFKLFEERNKKFEVVRKLPYKFSFIFQDDAGTKSKLMIEDWETGQLFWNCMDKYNDEKKACEDVKRKYLDDFSKTKDLYFFLGTTLLNHFVAPNPFIIIGTFHPKVENQISLF
ncbi:MAG: hypothetical protein WAM24_00205 [Ignavibacteriaceae bacterium]